MDLLRSKHSKAIALWALVFFIGRPVQAQSTDTVYLEVMDPIYIQSNMDEARRKEYELLKRRVRKTLPYAKMAATRMRAMEDKLQTIQGRRARNQYVKQCEAAIKAMYMEQLKNLTIGEGQVLMKLIHRETGSTTWEIMKDYRGTTEALMWQVFGSFWGHNLKVEFDPSVDYQIEHIIQFERLE
ncbi:MAG: DUF4294 domain-containing protein [Bacteroidia bacterium]|jgi:hypothetical protein